MLIFCIQINMKLFYNLITLIVNTQITRNNKFAKSLQYLKELRN